MFDGLLVLFLGAWELGDLFGCLGGCGVRGGVEDSRIMSFWLIGWKFGFGFEEMRR